MYIKNIFKRKKHIKMFLKEMHFKDNTLEMRMENPEFVALTDGLVKMFKKAGGINYVSVSTYHPDLGMFEVTIQRQFGKTPSQLNIELKEKISELEKQLSIKTDAI
jgi:hypothetical protein